MADLILAILLAVDAKRPEKLNWKKCVVGSAIDQSEDANLGSILAR
jgi:hypothetical protein